MSNGTDSACPVRADPGSAGRQQPAGSAARSPTGWTTSPASAGPCCARCPASRPSAPGSRHQATWACRYSSGGPTSATCSPSTTSASRTRATCAPPRGPAASRTWRRCSATSRLPASRPPGTWPRYASAAHPASRWSSRPGMQRVQRGDPRRPVADLRGRLAPPASFTGPSNVPVTLSPDTALRVTRRRNDAVRPARRPGQRCQGGRPARAGREQLRGEGQDNWSLVTVGRGHPGDRPGDRCGQHPGRVLRQGGDRRPHRPRRRTTPRRRLSRTVRDSTSYRLLRPTAAAALFNAAALWNPSDPLSAAHQRADGRRDLRSPRQRRSRSICRRQSAGSHQVTWSCSTAAPETHRLSPS